MSEELAPGFGHILAEAREAKGLTTTDVADKLKLTVRQVEAIEDEDLSRLPAPVFVRGFVRNYARLLDLPPESMPTSVSAPAVEPSATITAPSEGVVFRTSPVRRWLLVPLAILLLFVILVAGLYNWLKRGEDAYLTNAATSQPAAITAPVPAIKPAEPAAPAAAPPVESGEPTSAESTQDQVSPQVATPAQPSDGSSTAASATPAPLPPAATPPAQPVVAPLSTPPVTQPTSHATPQAYSYGASAAGTHKVGIVAQDEDTWVEVVSANQKHYSKLLQRGDSLTVQAVPPLKVIVGNARHVEVSYDGKAVDLKPYTGGNVARLTLQ